MNKIKLLNQLLVIIIAITTQLWSVFAVNLPPIYPSSGTKYELPVTKSNTFENRTNNTLGKPFQSDTRAQVIDLGKAVASASSAQRSLVISGDAACKSAVNVPASLVLTLTTKARIVKQPGCSISFEGLGIAHPMANSQIFWDFAPGDIRWIGANYPRKISAELWGTAKTTVQDKYNLADAAMSGKQVVINVFTGTITGQAKVTENHTLKFGAGDFANSSSVYPQFLLSSNTRITGAGKEKTTIHESSDLSALSSRLIYSTGASVYPFSAPMANITVDNIRFYSETDKPFETSSSAIFLGNVVGGSIHDCEFDSLHVYGAFVGGFADPDNSGKPHYAENYTIYNNVYKNLGTQNTGVIQGRNIEIYGNRFMNIGRTVKLVNDGVTDGSAVIRSATANFLPHYKGGSLTVSKSGSGYVTTSIVSVPNSRTLVLSRPIPFSASGVTVRIHNPFLTVIDMEPNHPNDILENISVHDNVIDARNAGYLANGIVAQLGGALSMKNIRIENNQILGADLPRTNSEIPVRGISIGIVLAGGNDSVVRNNYIRGTGQSGISVSNTVNSTITGNSLTMTGGGGNPGLQVIGSGNNTFSNNTLKTVGSGSQSDYTQETEYSGTCTVSAANGHGSILTAVSGVRFFPHNVGSNLVIGDATYTITEWIDLTHIKISRRFGGEMGVTPFKTRFNANRYDNLEKVVRSAGSYSTASQEQN